MHSSKVNTRARKERTPVKHGVHTHVVPVPNVQSSVGGPHWHCLMGKVFRHFANCKTQGVVYLMQCQCGAFYVGKTRQEFRKRVDKHMQSMQIGNLYLPLGRHVARYHNYRLPSVNFTVLDRIHLPLRGGDWNKVLLQREMRWIRYLRATTPPGLNETESFRPFLEGFSSGKTI